MFVGLCPQLLRGAEALVEGIKAYFKDGASARDPAARNGACMEWRERREEVVRGEGVRGGGGIQTEVKLCLYGKEPSSVGSRAAPQVAHQVVLLRWRRHPIEFLHIAPLQNLGVEGGVEEKGSQFHTAQRELSSRTPMPA